MNLQQLPRPVEMHDPMTFEEWAEKEEIDIEDVDMCRAILEDLEYKDGYPTGELKSDVSEEIMTEEVEQYLNYLKEWRAKNEENIMWKFYEIRDVFIPDEEDEVIMAFDKTNVEVKPCELLEVPKAT